SAGHRHRRETTVPEGSRRSSPGSGHDFRDNGTEESTSGEYSRPEDGSKEDSDCGGGLIATRESTAGQEPGKPSGGGDDLADALRAYDTAAARSRGPRCILRRRRSYAVEPRVDPATARERRSPRFRASGLSAGWGRGRIRRGTRAGVARVGESDRVPCHRAGRTSRQTWVNTCGSTPPSGRVGGIPAPR